NATNGTLTIVLDKTPTVDPVAGDFTATKAIDGGQETELALDKFKKDKATKTITDRITHVEQTVTRKSVVVGVEYKGTTK
ncbi:hypothetical protein GSQ54_22505, partial [Clostridioides difficile]|nr:hypothetical protein [Clostridioides difficile]